MHFPAIFAHFINKNYYYYFLLDSRWGWESRSVRVPEEENSDAVQTMRHSLPNTLALILLS